MIDVCDDPSGWPKTIPIITTCGVHFQCSAPLLPRQAPSSSSSSSSAMTDRKAVIKNADMSEDMQQDAVDCATQAMEKYNIEKDIAAYIKKVRQDGQGAWMEPTKWSSACVCVRVRACVCVSLLHHWHMICKFRACFIL